MRFPLRTTRVHALLAAACLAYGPAAQAGSGTFQGGAHNFCASVRFNATADQLAKIRTAFANGSQILADATDGQHRFGTIRIVNNSGASQSAEYWINPNTGRAYATFGKYGVRGEHVNLFYDSNFLATKGADGDAYTVAHEHAHHSYGVADEYSGPLGAAEDAPPPDTAALNFSLMDNYFTRGGRAFGGGYTLNEFCTASNHDPDHDTWQHAMYGMSVWEMIAAHPKRSATAPAGLPVDAAPAAHTVTFQEGFGGLRAMLLLDRSGSMVLEQRLDFAKQGANQFIGFFKDGDALGVASFSDTTSVNFALTPVTGAATRTAAQTAVNSLVASGATNIGGGLLTALGQITAQPERSCDELIILLSDGDHNTGTPPSAALPVLQAEGVTVLTVGVGTGISPTGQAQLQTIASATGGKYYAVASAADLVSLFLQLTAESTGQGLLARAPEAVTPGQTKELPVFVEAGVDAATFALTFGTATDALELTLRSPSGRVITPATPAADPAVTYTAGANSRVYRIAAPEAGAWSFVVAGGASVTSGKFEVLGFAEHTGLSLDTSLQKEALVFPEAALISASLKYQGERVVGAAVVGTVTRPDGSTVPVELFDDGQHGDGMPNDGIYAVRFTRYKGDGTYTIELNASHAAGRTYAGEDLFDSEPSNDRAVPAFTRVSRTTAIVTGVPNYVVATVEYGPETINLKSNGNFVTGYIELPSGFSPSDIDLASVKITAVDGVPIAPIAALSNTAIGDFDTDGVPDRMVKFSRAALQRVLAPGMRTLTLEGTVAGQLFIGERSVGVINPGRP